MAKTLNQILKTLKDLADSHYQINYYYQGDNWEWLANGDVTYPAMFTVIGEPNISVTDKTITYPFDLYFLDISKNDEVNEEDVLSDQLEIAKDILSQLKHPNFQWDVFTDAPIKFFTEFTEDSLSGCQMTVTLTMPYGVDRCQVPSDFEFPDDTPVLSADDIYLLQINP